MYNGKFGKLKYGLKDGATKVIKISAELSESTYNITGFGDTYFISSECLERVLVSFTAHSASLLETELIEEVHSESKIGTCYSITSIVQEDLSAKLEAKKNIFIVEELKDEVDNECYLSKNISLNSALADEIIGSLEVGKNIFFDIFTAEQVNADISANVLEKQIARLEITIPPGGELRIDSSLFNVIMNGENILHLYNGDWIMISRDTITIAVQTSTGGVMTGKMLLTERYL